MKFLNDETIIYECILYQLQEVFSRLVIRHDVDHSIEKALQMAKYEKERGFSSCFLIRHPLDRPNYYGIIENSRIVHSTSLLKHCERILELGHQIGLHYSALSYSFLHNTKPDDIFESELNWLRESGIPISMISPHGSTINYEKGFIEYELFHECNPEKIECWGKYGRSVDGIKLNSISMKEHGVNDFYFTDYDGYFSDSGGSFIRGYLREQRSFFEPQVRGMQNCLISSSIPKISIDILTTENLANIKSNGVCQLLIHPCWWI